jgi:hypothetical protein
MVSVGWSAVDAVRLSERVVENIPTIFQKRCWQEGAKFSGAEKNASRIRIDKERKVAVTRL